MRDPAGSDHREQVVMALLEQSGLSPDLVQQACAWWYAVASDCHFATLLIERRVVSLNGAQILHEVESGRVPLEEASPICEADGKRRLQQELSEFKASCEAKEEAGVSAAAPAQGVDRQDLDDAQAYWDSFENGAFIPFADAAAEPAQADSSSESEKPDQSKPKSPPAPGEFLQF